jgi:hypothetical protein
MVFVVFIKCWCYIMHIGHVMCVKVDKHLIKVLICICWISPMVEGYYFATYL